MDSFGANQELSVLRRRVDYGVETSLKSLAAAALGYAKLGIHFVARGRWLEAFHVVLQA
jgi:hypothetical protein